MTESRRVGDTRLEMLDFRQVAASMLHPATNNRTAGILLQKSGITHDNDWLSGTAVERWTLAGKLSLSCARPVAEG